MSTVEVARPTPRSETAGSSSSIGKHHPGLDGMRGLATIIVLLYHSQVGWTRGAFLALSQFFTLSGFLITGVLLRNHLSPGGGLRSFWVRRARRLMPAAFLCLAGVVVFGATVANHQQAQALPGDVLAAATWTANWHFLAAGQSYVDLFTAPSPVQHFWSLAIEEQFYLVLPIALLLLVRRTRSPRVLLGSLLAAALASGVWMVGLYHHGAGLDRLYYGTDTRMAELLAGSVLAVIISRRGLAFSERTRWILAGTGLVAFLLTWWGWINVSLTDPVSWEGGLPLFSIVSCAVIMGVLAGRGPVHAVLSWKPLAFVGTITYGLYLYHFPIDLWLTEDRTGLDRWPLLALRLSLTFVLATLSFYYVERPILRGASLGLHGRGRFVLIPVAAAVVVVATFVTVNRSATDPLATLRADAAELKMPRVASDGVLDLLVIPGKADDPVIARLQKNVEHNASVRITVAAPFRCTGGLVETKGGKTCANWARDWPALVKDHNPDAVLLYVDDWAGESLAKLSGRPPAGQGAAAAAILAPAFDLLSARDAPIVWASSGTNFAGAFRRTRLPFNQAMASLKAKRDDLLEVIGSRLPDQAAVTAEQFESQSASVLLSDVSLYQRTTGDGLPRVMIVGDSQALSLGYGFDRWSATNKRALVWNHGIEGCGVGIEGKTRTFGTQKSGLDRCRDAVDAWPGQLEAFKPDVVVVLSSLTDIGDRKLPGSSKFSSIGDPAFDSFLVKEYEHIVDTLSSTGARVVWMTAPCTAIKTVAGASPPYSSAHIDHLNAAILPKVFRARADKVVPFDLAAVMCPHGKPLESVQGVGSLRPDGVHFSVGGSLWFARQYGEKLLKAGGA